MDLTQLLPQFGGFAFTVAAFILALSIIVAVHEYGHYIVGRWSGIHADVFSIGFGPVLLSRTDRRGTRWQIAALPLGGYVKFRGDANATSVGADLREVPADQRRSTMTGAPLWARAATAAAGPIFNFIFSFVIFLGFLLANGQIRMPLVVDQIAALPPAFAHQLQPGDEIVAIDGRRIATVDDMSGLADSLPRTATVPYTVRRDGAEIAILGPNPYAPVIGTTSPRSPAYRAGLRPDEVITAVDGAPVENFGQIIDIVSASEGRDLTITLWSPGGARDVSLAPLRQDLPLPEGGFETRWLMGVTLGSPVTFETATPGLLTAMGESLDRIWFIMSTSLSGLWHVVTGAISSCHISGPVGIAQVSGAVASEGADSFLMFIGLLSTAVGLLNLFPVPMLDGGHLAFYAYEAVTRRAPSEGALRILMSVGLAAVLTLMVFALMNDLVLCP